MGARACNIGRGAILDNLCSYYQQRKMPCVNVSVMYGENTIRWQIEESAGASKLLWWNQLETTQRKSYFTD